MNIQKIFILSFVFVGFGAFLQAAEKSFDLTSARVCPSPQWAAEAKVDDSGSTYPSDNRISDDTKQAHKDAVDAKRKEAQVVRALALYAAPDTIRKLKIG